MKIYWKLSEMGFDLKKLKQLYYTIVEISLVNHTPLPNAVTKFLNDIEDQYDSKLGFETKIKELSAKKVELEDEIPEYNSNLQIQSLMAPLLLHLKNNRVTNKDIINMSQLVISFQNSTLLSDTSSQRGNTPNNARINNNTHIVIKNEYWRLIINKLRIIQNIDTEIEKLSIHRNELRSDINLLNTKKNEIEKRYLESTSCLNYVSLQLINALVSARQTNETNNKKITPFFCLCPIVVNLIQKKEGKNDESSTKRNHNN
jgi:hypothetical protein